ncbi:protein adenylyltransferase SelO family protein [Nocardioides perillae]|uniref:Protein nucleotidyltransferase YdiU n=1 Tax=Nocardioides perillae TaxID=1119534 RepID=A0A7Y9UUY7_9ACTN|nr:uncharacterized protein YdiU (UPF0061 family) [Nocardioides perillae]
MTVAPTAVRLDDQFARTLPEMAVPWQAAPAPAPRLLALDEALAAELGLDPAALRTPAGLALLTGTDVPDGARPVAQAYSGHQFGGFVPRLGDGRALLLGELVDRDGRVRDLHLKGSGRTPFARGGDGLAAVGPMLREHVVSTSLHALGVPTTRALAVVATGAPVQRETVLPGAVLARVAASHLRVGSVQYARATDDRDLLRRVADLAIARHHPAAADAEHPHRALYAAVVEAQAQLVAQWMLLGFVHGVLNTDNTTLSGETIDYGPCAFMEAFDPATVFSSIDEGGRYAWGNQPAVIQWNLARLAEALLPLLHDDEQESVAVAQAELGRFPDLYGAAWARGVRAKLGLGRGPADAVVTGLADDLTRLMHQGHVDWTSGWRALVPAAAGDAEPLRGLFLDLAGVDAWLERWRALAPSSEVAAGANPVYVARNHLVEEALAAATGSAESDGEPDLGPLERLVDVLRAPYDERPGLERYAAPAPQDFAAAYRTFCGT